MINLRTPEFIDNDPILSTKSGHIVKIIIKYWSHPSIHAIGEVCKKSQNFSLSFSQEGRRYI